MQCISFVRTKLCRCRSSDGDGIALSSALASSSPSSQSPSLVPGQDGNGSFSEATRGPEPAEMKIGQEWMGHTKTKP